MWMLRLFILSIFLVKFDSQIHIFSINSSMMPATFLFSMKQCFFAALISIIDSTVQHLTLACLELTFLQAGIIIGSVRRAKASMLIDTFHQPYRDVAILSAILWVREASTWMIWPAIIVNKVLQTTILQRKGRQLTVREEMLCSYLTAIFSFDSPVFLL